MSKRILVIGESCRDIFIYCDAKRLAPDIPVPVLHVLRKTQNPGMAMNMQRNVQALYPACDIVTNKNWRSVTKTRYVYEKTTQAFFRVDSSNHIVPMRNLRRIPLRRYDIIAISDYDKGFLTEKDIQYICEHHSRVFVDTKKPVGMFLKGAKFVKINKLEYEQSGKIASSIARKIICTKGGDGADFRGANYPVESVEVKAPSGAGDSFFAALVVHYALTNDIVAAIKFANICATEVVQHRGVTMISRSKPLLPKGVKI